MIRWTDTSPTINWPLHPNANDLMAAHASELTRNKTIILVPEQLVTDVLTHLQTPPAGLKTWFSGMPIEQGGLLIGRVTRLNETTPNDQFECIGSLPNRAFHPQR